MKISIAVPSYNYAQFLPACLDSILQQKHTDYEVLIADGGSIDGSIDIIEKYCVADKRFKLISREDTGQADAIRRAFSVANGDIMCFLNADDCYLHDQVFNRVVETFEHSADVEVATFGGYYLDGNGQRIKKINYQYHPMDGFHWMRYRTAVIQPATFWRRQVYEGAAWPSNFHFVFDVVFFYQAFLHYRWATSDEALAGYRLHGDNKSMWVKSKRIRELAAFEEIKFGTRCFRARYLNAIGYLVEKLESLGRAGRPLLRSLYFMTNSLAFLSFYRLPGI